MSHLELELFELNRQLADAELRMGSERSRADVWRNIASRRARALDDLRLELNRLYGEIADLRFKLIARRSHETK